MAIKDMERMKQLIEEKKKKNNFFTGDKKVGNGSVEKSNKSLAIDSERTKKISQ